MNYTIATSARISLFALFATACATTTPPASTVKPEDMSAAAHRQEAARERARADDAYARWQPNARTPLPAAPAGSVDGPRMYPIDLYPYNPTDRALADAERHLRHAREHEAAAVALEGFEDAECRDFAPKARAACPLLGPVASIEDRADGVRFVLAPGAPVAAIVAHMRCHLAFARRAATPTPATVRSTCAAWRSPRRATAAASTSPGATRRSSPKSSCAAACRREGELQKGYAAPAAVAAASGRCVVSTGRSAVRTTASATEPRMKRRNPRRPCDPMTIRSKLWAAA